MTLRALVEIDARIGRHGLDARRPALRTRQHGLERDCRRRRSTRIARLVLHGSKLRDFQTAGKTSCLAGDQSRGTKIHSSTYSSSPTPAQMHSAVKASRHIQASVAVDRPIPPHTPPNHRSVRLRRNALTADAGESCERLRSAFKRRSFARRNSSSVKPPLARKSANLPSSSASVMEHPLKRPHWSITPQSKKSRILAPVLRRMGSSQGRLHGEPCRALPCAAAGCESAAATDEGPSAEDSSTSIRVAPSITRSPTE